MTDALDKPPILPPGVEPHTVTEMDEMVARRLMRDNPGLEADTALHRAQASVSLLIAAGHLQEWGMRGEEPVYVAAPASKRQQAVVYIW